MNDASTGAMQELGHAPLDSQGDAGLVLLYADNHAELPSSWRLERGHNRVGRDPGGQVVIEATAVSRVHAEIMYERSGWTLRDLGSTNGTLLDGYRVREARLESGQEIRIGDALLKFVDADIEGYGAYRLTGGPSPTLDGEPTVVGGMQMQRIVAPIERIGPSELTVLLLGESGTGKEVIARAVHRASRREGPFLAVNCAAIPRNLLESELFGFKKGAFSGATRDKTGLIQAAHRGTLLLDEIGDMPLDAQAKLLRVLQSKEVLPVGATTPERADVRFAAATHQDLERLELEDRFRSDLYARLNEFQLRVPPLRERKEDLYPLLTAFLARYGRPELRVDFPFMAALVHYDWPYNVRELEACVRRCIALTDAPTLGIQLLPEAIQEEMRAYGSELIKGAPPGSSERSMPEADELRALLARHQGNVAAVGRELGKARMQIHRWLKRYAIDLGSYR